MRRLSKRFGAVEALRDVTMTVPRGITFGLLGPKARVLGHDIPPRGILSRIGYMPQETAVYADLTVAENLALFGRLRGLSEATFGASAAGGLSLTTDYVYGSEATRFIDSFAPGIVALAILLVTTVFSVIIVVREKAGGMLERLFATPLRPMELVVGHALALSVVAFFQGAVVLAAALLIFEAQVVGSLALAFGILLLFAVGNMGLGMMLSAAARNELQAVQFIPLVLFPSLLLTGVFFPLEAIPPRFRILSYGVPLTYAGDALRSVMLRGWGLGDVAVDILVLLGYTVLTLLGAAALVRRQA